MSVRFARPQDVETAFYRAFEQRDLTAMMAVWAEDPNVICVHPGGPMLIGPEVVRASWEEIFRHAPPMQFAIEDCARTTGRLLTIHVVQEHIRVRTETPPPVVATNIYRLTDLGWRLIVHHASVAAPRMGAEPGTLH